MGRCRRAASRCAEPGRVATVGAENQDRGQRRHDLAGDAYACEFDSGLIGRALVIEEAKTLLRERYHVDIPDAY